LSLGYAQAYLVLAPGLSIGNGCLGNLGSDVP
jgi:hypothetical protein